MFLGRQRHDRAVALGLAAALLGSLVLGLLVTLAAARGSGGGDGAPAPVSTPRSTPSPAQTLSGGRGAQEHEGENAGDTGPLGIHPGLLVASLVGVVLLAGTGLVVQLGARRRAERAADPEASYGGSYDDPWDRRRGPYDDERDEQWDGRWDES